jgi:vitamin B12 transporter
MRLLLVPAALVLAVTPVLGGSGPQVLKDEIEVSATRLTVSPARATTVLTRDEISRLPVRDLASLLTYVAGGGIARRSATGMQADVQLRGATFEQVAVIVDGIRVNDPQTGHFHLNVPLPLDAIDRIEILLGPGSSVHGPDAFGGVIAISTSTPQSFTARVAAGQHERVSLSATTPIGRGSWASGEAERSGGFRAGTDYSFARGAAGWSGESGVWKLRSTLSGEQRRFGAYAFYSDRFPDQWERNDIALLSAEASRPLAGTELTVRAGARDHRDRFLLDRARPAFYDNRHHSTSTFTQATLRGARGRFEWSAGVEGEHSTLRSNRLGDRDRSRGALFGEGSWRSGRLTAGGSLRSDSMSGLATELSPALGLELAFHRATVAVHRGRSFRQPSFTDLYYDSPGTVGNPALDPERAWTDELLLRVPVAATLLEFSAFRRNSSDLIDYVLDDRSTWRATNYARSRTDGLQASLFLPTAAGPFSGLKASAAWLDSDLDADPSRSRYALSHPRFEASVGGRVSLPAAVTADVGWRFRQPLSGPSFGLVDVRLARPLNASALLEVEATNLFDRSYREFAGVPMPGRWVTVGVRLRGRGI